MKKFLFTLAALLSLGFAAQADNMYPGQYLNDGPTIVYGDIDGNEITEVTVTPGGDGVELSLILKQMNCTMISGFGAQWRMYDASHNGINYATTAMVQCAKVYGTRTKFWFNPVGIGTNDPDQGGYNGVSLANSTPYDNVYRILATNTVENMIFFVEDLDGNPTCPAVFGNFTVKATADWEEDFATFELDQEYSLFNQCPDYDPNDYWEARCADPQVLTIRNANATPAPTKVADPVVSFVEDGDVLTVTMTCETEGAHIWVDGVDKGEAPYTYTVNRTYENQVISGTAVGKKDNMEDSEEVPFSYNFAAKEKTPVAAPVISFTQDDYYVYFSVEWPESDGEQVYVGRYSYPRIDENIIVVVEAYVTEGPTCAASEHTKIWVVVGLFVAPPVITFDEQDDVLTVNVSSETECATLYVNGQEVTNPYTYTVTHENIYEEQTVNVEAYAKKSSTTTSTQTASYTFAAQERPHAESPVITFDEDDNGVMIAIENYTEYTIKVDGVQVDPTRNDPHSYYVEKVYDKAQAIEVYAKNDPGYPVVAAEKTEYYNLPAKEKAQNSTPSIRYSYDREAGTITIWGYGCTEDDVVYTLIDPDGVEHESPYTFNYNTAEGYDEEWTAYAVSPTTTQSATCARYVTVAPLTPTPVVTIDDDSDPTIITATGEGTITIFINGEPVASGTGTVTYVIPWGTEAYFVAVYVVAHIDNQSDGFTDTQDAYVGVAEPPVTEVGEPTFTGYTIDGVTGYGVYIFPSTPADADIMYRVFTWNPETEAYDIPVTDGWQEYTGAEGEIYYTDMGGKYRVEAYAYVGDVMSEQIGYEFVVHVPTALDEMMGGKTVAGVRYYNMAGQEMQEANGVTIVVTTYTDGTTSAVKVLK